MMTLISDPWPLKLVIKIIGGHNYESSGIDYRSMLYTFLVIASKQERFHVVNGLNGNSSNSLYNILLGLLMSKDSL